MVYAIAQMHINKQNLFKDVEINNLHELQYF